MVSPNATQRTPVKTQRTPIKLLYIYPPVIRERGALGLLVIRLVAGLALVLHGLPKLSAPFSWMEGEQAAPGILQALAVLAEVGGGAALMFGFLTPVAALGVFFTMLVALINTHIMAGHPFVSGSEGPSFESAALHLAIAAMLFLTGPGVLSIDHWLFHRRMHDLADRA